MESTFNAAIAASMAVPGTNGSASTPRPEQHPFDVLTLSEAAAYLRVPESDLLTEVEGGKVPGRRLGTEWRFLRFSLTEWLHELGKREKAGTVVLPEKGNGLAALIGCLADDPTAEEFIRQVKKDRKRHRVCGKA